ncbi:MAG: tripartite tricarboxylate transporter substrate binding protein [Pseudomonadota bacterium]
MAMRRSRFLAWLAASAATSLCLPARAQERYPSKPIRFIVPAAVGGPTDVIGRIVAERLGAGLGQTVIVENRPGASATLGPAAVAKAAPDGYTLLFTSATPMVMVPNTMKNVPYDVQKDLLAVSIVGSLPLMLCVNASSPIHSINDLLEQVRAKPESASYGSFGAGTSAHLMMEILLKQTGLKMIHVPYKGIAPGLQDLIGGQLMTAVSDIGTAAPLIKGGRVRAIAIAGGGRSTLMPQLPTFAEQGIRGMEVFAPWMGVFAPAGTPADIVERVSAELVKVAKSPEYATRMAPFGIDPTGTNPARSQETVATDLRTWKGVVSDLSHIKFE